MDLQQFFPPNKLWPISLKTDVWNHDSTATSAAILCLCCHEHSWDVAEVSITTWAGIALHFIGKE